MIEVVIAIVVAFYIGVCYGRSMEITERVMRKMQEDINRHLHT